ncbi:MAG: glucose-6-phosphate dehydrogenase [Pseudomonadota bacterium]
MEKARNIVIFGGNGDLAMRKLLPALYHLYAEDLLQEKSCIVGIARKVMTQDEYRHFTKQALQDFVEKDFYDEVKVRTFLEHVVYVQLDAYDKNAYEALNIVLNEKGDVNKGSVFYFATPPELFQIIGGHLNDMQLTNAVSRIVVEKPIGTDLQSSITINEQLAALFPENNIYRIDHYLGKTSVQNLLALRFANRLFEPLWSQDNIDSVQITCAELVGVEGRWDYYDNAGALRDMVQNHLLQLLCLVAMEPPAQFDVKSIRDEKIKVLRSLRPLVDMDVLTNTVRGQYRSGVVNDTVLPAYTSEAGQGKKSDTETFVAMRAYVDNWRWAGVPFYLRTGKRLTRRYSEIVIQFKPVSHAIFSQPLTANRLVIRLQPNQEIKLILMNKEPGLSSDTKLEPVPLNLSLLESFRTQRSPGAYERLLYDAIKGDGRLFMSRYEVEEAWRWIDNVLQGWEKMQMPVSYYHAGGMGPMQSDQLLSEDGRQWLNPNFDEI